MFDYIIQFILKSPCDKSILSSILQNFQNLMVKQEKLMFKQIIRSVTHIDKPFGFKIVKDL